MPGESIFSNSSTGIDHKWGNRSSHNFPIYGKSVSTLCHQEGNGGAGRFCGRRRWRRNSRRFVRAGSVQQFRFFRRLYGFWRRHARHIDGRHHHYQKRRRCIRLPCLSFLCGRKRADREFACVRDHLLFADEFRLWNSAWDARFWTLTNCTGTASGLTAGAVSTISGLITAG